MRPRDTHILILCSALALGCAVACSSADRQPERVPQTASTPPEIPKPALPPSVPAKDVVTSAKLKGGVEILGIGLAAEGTLISVSYKVPPSVARRIRQGTVYVVDEANNKSYREVPVMPAMGP
ncbi:MAG: hypothetical protein ABSH28_24745 [Acidobacteriota bacterium]